MIAYTKDPLNPIQYRNKDAIFVVMGALSGVLEESKTFNKFIEPFFLQHVIPEFISPIPYIRFRAFWIVEYYNDRKWKNKDIFITLLKSCLNGLRDTTIPVRTAAACSMRLMLEDPKAHDIIRPILHEVVNEYFKLMDEVDSSSILSVVQTIVMQFGNDLSSIAPAMINKIIEQFKEYVSDASEENDEAAFSAVECLETVCSILDTVCENEPDILIQIEPYVVPLIYDLLTNGSQYYEYIENIISILGYLTYYSENISNNVWILCGPLLYALDDWAIDYIYEISTPILNYISKDINKFLTLNYEGISHLDKLMKIIEKVLLNETSSQRENKTVLVFIVCLFTSCENQQLPLIYITKILEILLTKLGKDELENHTNEKRIIKDSFTGFRIKLLEAILSLIIYNASYCLELLKVNDVANKLFFNILFLNLSNMSYISSQKIIVMAFSCIMKCLPLNNLPIILHGNMQPMLQQMVREIKLIKEEEEKENEEDDDEYNENSMDDNDDNSDNNDDEDENLSAAEIKKLGKLNVPDGGYDENEDCINVEDESYREYVNNMTKDDKVKHILYRNGELVSLIYYLFILTLCIK